MRVRFSPSHIPKRPSSHPLITWYAPTAEHRFSNAAAKHKEDTHESQGKSDPDPRWNATAQSPNGDNTELHYLESNLFPFVQSFPVCSGR